MTFSPLRREDISGLIQLWTLTATTLPRGRTATLSLLAGREQFGMFVFSGTHNSVQGSSSFECSALSGHHGPSRPGNFTEELHGESRWSGWLSLCVAKWISLYPFIHPPSCRTDAPQRREYSTLGASYAMTVLEKLEGCRQAGEAN